MGNSTGVSVARLDVLTRCLQEHVDARRIPGVVMLVARHGRVVYESALGTQDPATGKTMSFDTIFRIYSMTKPIVSIAIMMLAEQGRLLLSDSVTKYLPELRGVQVGIERAGANGETFLELEPTRQPITIQDLLRHTSGLTYGIFGDSAVKAAYRDAGIGSAKHTNDEFIRRLAGVPLAYQPGTVWEYSASTDVLGVVLERIHGKPLDEVLADCIFKPLGMHETGFWVEEGKLHRVAQPFDTDPVTGIAVKLSKVQQKPNFLSGGGGLVSTLHDYLRFVRMLANGGELDGVRLVSRKTLQFMTSDHLAELPLAKSGPSYLPGAGCGFGLGFSVRTAAGSAFVSGSVGDFTWSGLAGTYFWVDPQEDLFAIYLMQAPEQRNAYRQLFRNLVYAAIE